MTFTREQNQKGGKLGGPGRAKKLSKERRAEIARSGGLARWAKHRLAHPEAAQKARKPAQKAPKP